MKNSSEILHAVKIGDFLQSFGKIAGKMLNPAAAAAAAAAARHPVSDLKTGCY